MAGDGLLTLAFGLLARAGREARDRARVLEAMEIIARAAGHQGMVGGQAADLAAEGRRVGREEVEFIHLKKTAALIAAAASAGGVLGGGDKAQADALDAYGRALGLAFQIIDDILDIEGETEDLGKPAGSDQARGKATWPAVVGLSEARREAERQADRARAALEGFGPDAQPLGALADYLLTRKK